MDFVDYVEAADSDGVYRGLNQSVEPPQYQQLPIATLRASVQRRQDLPLFPELLHDVDTDDHGDTVLVNSRVDMEMYRRNVCNPPVIPKDWQAEGKDDFLRAIGGLSIAAALSPGITGRYKWSIVLDPDKLEPLAAYRQVRAESSE